LIYSCHVIDEKTLEDIVRAVVQKILTEHPHLIQRQHEQGGVVQHYDRVLSEEDLIMCRKQGKHAIRVHKGTIITPLARDRARDLRIDVLVSDEPPPRF